MHLLCVVRLPEIGGFQLDLSDSDPVMVADRACLSLTTVLWTARSLTEILHCVMRRGTNAPVSPGK